MAPLPGTDALLAALEQELASLQDLERALGAERDALTGRDPAALEAAVAEKGALLDRHRRSQEQRIAHCDGRTLGEAIALLPTAAGATALRQQIIEHGERCEALNRENGQLIRRQQERARQALGILRDSDRGLRLYAGDGSTEQGGDRQSLGKA